MLPSWLGSAVAWRYLFSGHLSTETFSSHVGLFWPFRSWSVSIFKLIKTDSSSPMMTTRRTCPVGVVHVPLQLARASSQSWKILPLRLRPTASWSMGVSRVHVSSSSILKSTENRFWGPVRQLSKMIDPCQTFCFFKISVFSTVRSVGRSSP